MQSDTGFLVYWRTSRAQRQLFAYRMPVQAGSAREARRGFQASHPRHHVVGVKASPDGRRVAMRGRWVG